MKLCHSVTVNLASAVMHFTWLNFMIQKPSSFNILALPIFLTFSLYCDLVLDIFGFLQLCEVFLAQDVGLYAPKVL